MSPESPVERDRALLALALAPGLGSAVMAALLERLESSEAVLEAVCSGAAENALPEGDKRTQSALRQARAWCRKPRGALWEKHLEWLDRPDHHLLALDDARYPELLRSIERPPWLLFAVGRLELLWQPQVAVVGSRNPGSHGLQQAGDLAGGLSRAGLVVTSGLALGIDAAAHRAALAAGGGTIAVMGTGVDRIYPAGNRKLGQQIATDGLLLSEFVLGTEARAGHFPARNRIISGLSLATVVVEAGLRSGSLITARLASEQGREVMAMPGSVRNPTSRGCHALIRDGARLVENAIQVLEDLAPLAGHLAGELLDASGNEPARAGESGQMSAPGVDSGDDGPDIARDDDYRKLWQALGHDPMSVDHLVEDTGLTPESVSSMLLLLELHGMVQADAAGWIRTGAAAANEADV